MNYTNKKVLMFLCCVAATSAVHGMEKDDKKSTSGNVVVSPSWKPTPYYIDIEKLDPRGTTHFVEEDAKRKTSITYVVANSLLIKQMQEQRVGNLLTASTKNDAEQAFDHPTLKIASKPLQAKL